MRILFLDIDGVANCSSTKERFRGFIGIDPEKAAIIKEIIQATRCTVILSSTWRLDAPFRAEVRRKVCNFKDVTPHLNGPRGQEIAQWLEKNAPEPTTPS